MDMRATDELKPEDTFQYIVFGGVVGDDPPQDRAADLRQSFKHVRNLGPI